MADIHALHRQACQAMAELIAYRIHENAKDNGEDPLTYATDTEIVMLYCGDIASDISARLAEEVKNVVLRDILK